MHIKKSVALRASLANVQVQVHLQLHNHLLLGVLIVTTGSSMAILRVFNMKRCYDISSAIGQQ
jgi:hypothetical protein